jgi:hypothetical protein
VQRYGLLSVSVLACVGLLPLPVRSDGAATATPPPQIYHTVTTALCARLHERVRPAVAMILENDTKIAKSPPLFKKYQIGTLSSYQTSGNAPSNGDSIYNQSPETTMALQQMSYLVIPIARNLIAAQTLLDDVKLVAPTGNPADDASIARIKSQLLQTIAYQSASLDLINGFVQTQQMGDLQHVGTEYLGAINGTDMTTTIIKQTPSPWQDPNTPGISPNPYVFDPATIPGLAVGYNPLNRIMDGMHWLQTQTGQSEDVAGKSITAALAGCGR